MAAGLRQRVQQEWVVYGAGVARIDGHAASLRGAHFEVALFARFRKNLNLASTGGLEPPNYFDSMTHTPAQSSGGEFALKCSARST